MVTEDPEVTGLDVHVRLVGDRRDLVGITEVRPTDAVFVGKLRQHPGQGGIAGLELGQERGERILLRGRHRRQGIEGREDEPLLGVGQLDVQDRDRRFTPADRELDPKMAVDDVAGRPVDEDLATQPTSARAPARAACCSFGWVRQLAGLARSCSGASSPLPTMRFRQAVVMRAAARLPPPTPHDPRSGPRRLLARVRIPPGAP